VVLGVFVVGGTEPVTSAAFVAVSHTAWPTTCTPVSIQVYSVSGQGFAPFYFPFLFLEERYFLFTFKKRKILPPDVLSRRLLIFPFQATLKGRLPLALQVVILGFLHANWAHTGLAHPES